MFFELQIDRNERKKISLREIQKKTQNVLNRPCLLISIRENFRLNLILKGEEKLGSTEWFRVFLNFVSF